MTTKRGIGILLAVFLLGCGSSSSTKKIPDAATTGRDAAAAEVATAADAPGAGTETAPPIAPDATARIDAAVPDAAPAGDAATAQDVPQAIDATAALDQRSISDTAGQRLDGASAVDGGAAIDGPARADGAAADLRPADASLTLPDVGLPDLRNLLPDLNNLLPDLAGGANCSNLAACCPNAVAALQTTCTNAVANGSDSACAALLATFTLAGYCP